MTRLHRKRWPMWYDDPAPVHPVHWQRRSNEHTLDGENVLLSQKAKQRGFLCFPAGVVAAYSLREVTLSAFWRCRDVPGRRSYFPSPAYGEYIYRMITTFTTASQTFKTINFLLSQNSKTRSKVLLIYYNLTQANSSDVNVLPFHNYK